MKDFDKKCGFVPALGTPLDEKGNLARDPFEKQINLMVESGALAVLCMGSMGNMVSLTGKVYSQAVGFCMDVAAGRAPVYAGVMDNSVARVLERIESLKVPGLSGVVATTPFYYKSTQAQILTFYKKLAAGSKYPLYMYDLPSVTQSPVEASTLSKLMKTRNVAGIKTANLQMLTDLQDEIPEDFQVYFSGLDIFDRAIGEGFCSHLDGMFTCTPETSKSMYERLLKDDRAGFKNELDKIIGLRDIFIRHGVFSSYSHAMRLLGMPGTYHPDYHEDITREGRKEIEDTLNKMGEI